MLQLPTLFQLVILCERSERRTSKFVLVSIIDWILVMLIVPCKRSIHQLFEAHASSAFVSRLQTNQGGGDGGGSGSESLRDDKDDDDYSDLEECDCHCVFLGIRKVLSPLYCIVYCYDCMCQSSG